MRFRNSRSGHEVALPVYSLWLPTNRWGMEAVGNLDNVSARAATLIIGGLKIAGAIGGPTRRIALVPRRGDDD